MSSGRTHCLLPSASNLSSPSQQRILRCLFRSLLVIAFCLVSSSSSQKPSRWTSPPNDLWMQMRRKLLQRSPSPSRPVCWSPLWSFSGTSVDGHLSAAWTLGKESRNVCTGWMTVSQLNSPCEYNWLNSLIVFNVLAVLTFYGLAVAVFLAIKRGMGTHVTLVLFEGGLKGLGDYNQVCTIVRRRD